jgi:hypothetical protein
VRRISTGIEQLLTAEVVADAVLTYATVLARANTADSITIPILKEDGRIDRARLLLGPASQLTIVPDGTAEVELPGADDVVSDLHTRTARLEPTAIREDEPAGESSFPDFDEYD